MIFGMIFDWDGVVLDSSRFHKESWNLLARKEGRTLPPDHFKQGFGRKNEDIISGILKWTDFPKDVHRLSLSKETLYRGVMRYKGISALPGVEAFLKRLKKANVPCVVGSSTHKANILLGLKLLNFEIYFQSIISAEDVTAGKPNPEVFLKAAEAIPLPPSRCIVFEDAPVGIQAARAGGFKVVAVTTTHSVQVLKTADKVVKALDELGLQDLEDILR